MPDFFLEFEKPISELQKKIAELENISQSNNLDVKAALDALNIKLDEMTREIYSNLTPWQRIQLSRHPERPYTLDYIEHLFNYYGYQH